MVKIRFLSTRPSPTSGGRICELHTLLSSFGRIRKDTDSGGPDPVNRAYHPSASPGRNAYTACGLDLDIEHTAAHGTDYGTTIGIGPSSHYRRHRPFIAWPCTGPGAPRRQESERGRCCRVLRQESERIPKVSHRLALRKMRLVIGSEN